MDWIVHQGNNGRKLLSPLSIPAALVQPPPPPPVPPPPPPPSVNTLESKISPSILLIIVILAVIFFISGLLHLLVRFLLRPQTREPEDMDSFTALQGQLQQLFHLHDAGVDQSFIDALPVFLYKTITGVKDPFDCAVCLCEFEADDKLRLLPKCSHAFHLECIDTWLLSHSTCPLCRRSLLHDFSPGNNYNPMVLVLESGSESSREMGSDRRDNVPSSFLGCHGEDSFRSTAIDALQKPVDMAAKEDADTPGTELLPTKVVSVKLGKFRSVEAAGGGAGGEGTSKLSSSNLDERRCFSMGSYEYVMDESSLLQVAIRPPKKRPLVKRPGHRSTMSEYDGRSRREGFKGFEMPRRSLEFFKPDSDNASKGRRLHKKESFSVSKTWLRTKREKPVPEDPARRAFSFRLPLHPQPAYDDPKHMRITSPEQKNGRQSDSDVEAASVGSGRLSRADETPSFARRTLLYIVGRQNRV